MNNQKVFCQNCQEDTQIVDARCATCGENICRKCGCTDSEPCADVCEWIEDDLCSNCVSGQQEHLGESNIFVCLGAPEHLISLKELSDENRPQQSIYWTVNKNAAPRDRAIFYLTYPISAIVGFGNIISSPWIEEDSEWKEKNYTEINRVRIFSECNFITNREIKTLFPEWIFWKQPRQSVATPKDLLHPFWELLNERWKNIK